MSIVPPNLIPDTTYPAPTTEAGRKALELIDACYQDILDHKKIKLLMDEADLNQQDGTGCTPLIACAVHGHEAYVQELIARGADPDLANVLGISPLEAAIHNRKSGAACLLIQAGARIDARIDWNATLLHEAVSEGLVDVVAALIARGANLNAKNDSGFTALHKLACRYKAGKNHIACGALLLEAGVDFRVTDFEGRTAERVAEEIYRRDEKQGSAVYTLLRDFRENYIAQVQDKSLTTAGAVRLRKLQPRKPGS